MITLGWATDISMKVKGHTSDQGELWTEEQIRAMTPREKRKFVKVSRGKWRRK